MWSSDSHLKRVCAAATDGRTTNVRFIQTQLRNLHQSILDTRVEIIQAIASNPLMTGTEAEVEYLLAISSVRKCYEELNFEKIIADEYKVAKGQNNPHRRVGYGVVLIKPTAHTRFYSIMSPAACAIATGNTFVVENCCGTPVDRVLCSVFQSLDWETYGLVQGPVTGEPLISTALVVDQTGTSTSANLVSAKEGLRAIAVIDRTADVEKAVQHILGANVAFGGKSPNAPDFIVVNEWVKQQFLDTILCQARSLAKSPNSYRFDHNVELKEILIDSEAKGKICSTKAQGLCLIDAQNNPEYLVAYHFAEPDACKFLSQQIRSQWTFVNHLPIHLLGKKKINLYHCSEMQDKLTFQTVGPALLPNSTLSQRYTSYMFSRPRPEFIQPTEDSVMDLTISQPNENAQLLSLGQREQRPLPATMQGPGTAIGFFEQGIIVGGICIVLPVISFLGYSGWILTRRILYLVFENAVTL
ncbi:unnamed protein product [Penicillium salamii]|nr:unnamed protein product [Penicillium salamii]